MFNPLCRRRVLTLEKHIEEFLAAWDMGEMGNRDKAIDRLRRDLSQRRSKKEG
jgi:hypothetical protein